MTTRLTDRLEVFFKRRTDEDLRSIIKYEQQSCDITYLRDDVAAQYTEEEIETAVNDSRLESLTVPVYGDIYSEDHGEITCLVKCFENVIEMNFVLSDGVGAVVALDVDALSDDYGLVAQARELLVEESM